MIVGRSIDRRSVTGLRLAVAAAALLWLAVAAVAQTFPALTGRIVDQANVISADARRTIEPKLVDLETKSGIQLVVATVNSLEGQEIEPYANALFRKWQLGEKTKNNGVLLLIAPKERRVRIEVGYGLEGALNDATAKRIVSDVIVPRFRENGFGGAAPLRPAREGHDAVCAALVAAFNNRDVGAIRIVALRVRSLERFLRVEAQAGNAAVSVLDLHQHFRQLRVARRARHQRDMRRLFENLLALLLGDAADHGEGFLLAVRTFSGGFLEEVEAIEDFLLGLIANRAGVVDNQLRFLDRGNLRVALVDQSANDFFRVMRIHLATESLDVKRLHPGLGLTH